MTRNLRVEVIADPTLFKRGLNESSAAASKFEGHIKGVSHSVLGSFGAMTGGLLAAGGLVVGLKASITAAENFSVALKSTDQAVKATGGSVAAYRSKLNDLATAGAKLGYTNTDVLGGLKTLTLVTGNATDATKYMGLAEDIARAKGVSLQAAATAVGKAIDGKTTALQRYGIVATKGESIEQLLTAASARYAGQAAANTTVTEKLHATMTNLEQKIGAVLLPTVEKLATSFEAWISKAGNVKRITDDVRTGLSALRTVVETVRTVFDAIDKATGSLGNTLKIMGIAGAAAFVAIKAAFISTGVGAILVAAGLAAGYTITHWKQVRDFFEGFWRAMQDGFSILWDALKIGAYKAALDVIEPFSHLPSFMGKWARDAKTNLESGLASIQSDMHNNVSAITNEWQAGGARAGTSWADAFVGSIKGRNLIPANITGGGSTGTHDTTGGTAASRAASPGGHFSESQMAGLLIKAGASPQLAGILANIAYLGESGGNAGAVSGVNKNGTRDYGLFQINSSHGYSQAAMLNPLQNAKEALSIYHSQGFGAWTEAYGRAAVAKYGNWLTGVKHTTYGDGGGGKKKKGPVYKIPQALEAKIRLSQQTFTDDVSKSHLASLDALYRQEESLLKAHGQDAKAASVANEITKAGATFQKMLAALHLKVAQQMIGKIETESTGPAQALALAQAAGEPVAEILADQKTLLGSYQTEASQLKAHLATSTGKAQAAYKSALAKVQSSVVSTQNSIVSSLQTIATAAQARLQSVIGSIETAADAALGKQYAQGGLQTPSEALLSGMQAEDTKKQLQDALTQAITAGDPAAIAAAQRAITESDLATQATKERAAADAAYASAQWNLNRQIELLSANVGTGAGAQDKLNALLGQFGISIGDLSDPGGNGLLTQLQDAVAATTAAFENLTFAVNHPGGGTGSAAGGTGGLGGSGAAYGGGSGASIAGIAVNPYAVARAFGGGSFASGGPVGGALGAPMLAVVHGGETVIPAGSFGGGIVVNVTHHGPLVGSGGMQELANTITKEINRSYRRGTGLLGTT